MPDPIDSHDPHDDDLASVPADRLAAMLRDKRKAEAAVRTRLREAEEARDKLAAGLTAWQSRAFADKARAAGVIDSALEDLPGRVDLASLLTEDGTLDDDKATAALSDLQVGRPHWFVQKPAKSGPEFAAGTGEKPSGAAASWSDILY